MKREPTKRDVPIPWDRKLEFRILESKKTLGLNDYTLGFDDRPVNCSCPTLTRHLH